MHPYDLFLRRALWILRCLLAIAELGYLLIYIPPCQYPLLSTQLSIYTNTSNMPAGEFEYLRTLFPSYFIYFTRSSITITITIITYKFPTSQSLAERYVRITEICSCTCHILLYTLEFLLFFIGVGSAPYPAQAGSYMQRGIKPNRLKEYIHTLLPRHPNEPSSQFWIHAILYVTPKNVDLLRFTNTFPIVLR